MSDSQNKNFFSRLFSSKAAKKDERANADDDYIVKKNKTVDIIIRIASILFAIIIWVYVVLSDSVTYQYKDIAVQLRNERIATSLGYEVAYQTSYVTITVKGRASKISQITADSITAYVDVSGANFTEITGTKTVSLPIVFDLSKDLTITEKSVETIQVVITANSAQEAPPAD